MWLIPHAGYILAKEHWHIIHLHHGRQSRGRCPLHVFRWGGHNFKCPPHYWSTNKQTNKSVKNCHACGFFWQLLTILSIKMTNVSAFTKLCTILFSPCFSISTIHINRQCKFWGALCAHFIIFLNTSSFNCKICVRSTINFGLTTLICMLFLYCILSYNK